MHAEDEDDAEQLDAEKTAWVKSKTRPSRAEPPRSHTRGPHAANLHRMGYDTDREVEIDREP